VNCLEAIFDAARCNNDTPAVIPAAVAAAARTLLFLCITPRTTLFILMLSSENFRCKSDNPPTDALPESDAAVSSINVKHVVWNKNVEMRAAFRLHPFPVAQIGRLGLHPQSMTHFITEQRMNTDTFLRPRDYAYANCGPAAVFHFLTYTGQLIRKSRPPGASLIRRVEDKNSR
jgi:hypothetical protein